MKLNKWGDSIGVRLPASQLRSLGWKVGDELMTREYNGGLMISRVNVNNKRAALEDVINLLKGILDETL